MHFFGHRDCPESVKPKLKKILIDLIEENREVMFYVGNQGRFDAMALRVIQELKKIYPQTKYAVVLAYFPQAEMEYKDTILPEGIETVPKRFAISYRNAWMLKKSCCVVAFTTHDWGGAAKYVQMAEKQNKRIIRIETD